MITDFVNNIREKRKEQREKRKEQKVQEAVAEYKNALLFNESLLLNKKSSTAAEKKLLSIAEEEKLLPFATTEEILISNATAKKLLSIAAEKKLISIAKEYPEHVAPMLDQLFQETLSAGHREIALRTATDLFLDCPKLEKYTKPWLEKIRKNVDEYNEVARTEKAQYKPKIDIPQGREEYPQVRNPYRGPEPIEIYKEKAVKERFGASVSQTKAIMMKQSQNGGK